MTINTFVGKRKKALPSKKKAQLIKLRGEGTFGKAISPALWEDLSILRLGVGLMNDKFDWKNLFSDMWMLIRDFIGAAVVVFGFLQMFGWATDTITDWFRAFVVVVIAMVLIIVILSYIEFLVQKLQKIMSDIKDIKRIQQNQRFFHVEITNMKKQIDHVDKKLEKISQKVEERQ